MQGEQAPQPMSSRSGPAPPTAAVRSRRRAIAALYGGALGLWWSLCILGFSHGAQRAWGLLALDADADFQLFPMDRVAVKFAQRIGLRFIDSLSSATLLLVLLGLVGGYVVSAIGQQLRIDPQRLSRRALLDARSQIGSLSAWMGPVVLLSLALSFIYVDRQPAWLSSGSWVAGLLLAAFSPFLVLNRSMLAESGIRVKFDVVDASQFNQFRRPPYRGDYLMARWGGRADPPKPLSKIAAQNQRARDTNNEHQHESTAKQHQNRVIDLLQRLGVGRYHQDDSAR